MATKKTWKNRIQKILSSRGGIYQDDYWTEVHAIWEGISNIGGDVIINSANYQEENGVPMRKVWEYTIEIEGYTFHGILTAHGAGTVQDPLSRYDISAYFFD